MKIHIDKALKDYLDEAYSHARLRRDGVKLDREAVLAEIFQREAFLPVWKRLTRARQSYGRIGFDDSTIAAGLHLRPRASVAVDALSRVGEEIAGA